MTSPLLVRNPQTNKYVVNFDPYVIEVVREAEYILKFGLDVPDFIKIIYFRKNNLSLHVETIKDLVQENNKLRQSIPPLFLKLMKPCLIELETAFQPCLATVTWTSLEIHDVCENIKSTLKEVEIFIKKIIDMKETRIDGIFVSIAGTQLIQFCEYPQYPEDFSGDISKFTKKVGNELGIKSSTAEEAVVGIINKFVDLVDDPSVESTKYDWMDPSKVSKPVTSHTKLIEDSFELGNLHIYFISHIF